MLGATINETPDVVLFARCIYIVQENMMKYSLSLIMSFLNPLIRSGAKGEGSGEGMSPSSSAGATFYFA